jgi:hypothetical protein
MYTLALPHRQLPDGLYRPRKAMAPMRRRRKAVPVADPRSMTQEDILALQAAARPSLKQLLLAPEARTDGLVPARGQARRRAAPEL